MVLAGGTAAALLLGVEPFDLGLPGVWYAMGLLMVSRLGTMVWRYQSESGPLPPSAERVQLSQPASLQPAAALLASGSGGSSSGGEGGSAAGLAGSGGSSASSVLGSVEDLSNNALESPLPPQGAVRREAGSSGPRR